MAKPATRKSRIKYYLVAILVVIVIALILGVPRYIRFQKESRIKAIHTAMEALRHDVDDYWQTNNLISGYGLDLALQKLKIPAKVLKEWDFVIAWKDTEIYTAQMVEKLKDVSENRTVFVAPYRLIMAVATKENPLKEGKKVWYDGDNNSFHGFGYDDKVEPDWRALFPNP